MQRATLQLPFPDLGRHFSTYFLIYYTLCFLTL